MIEMKIYSNKLDALLVDVANCLNVLSALCVCV